MAIHYQRIIAIDEVESDSGTVIVLTNTYKYQLKKYSFLNIYKSRSSKENRDRVYKALKGVVSWDYRIIPPQSTDSIMEKIIEMLIKIPKFWTHTVIINNFCRDREGFIRIFEKVAPESLRETIEHQRRLYSRQKGKIPQRKFSRFWKNFVLRKNPHILFTSLSLSNCFAQALSENENLRA